MIGRLRKLSLAALALLALLALSACGNADTKVTTGTYAGESGVNAPYLDVGPLKYEVQVSRQLNPTNGEDASYLKGITPADLALEPGQEWFAVFMQVYNPGHQAHPASSSIVIYDTQGNVYTPLSPGASNEYAYRGGSVPANGQLPELDTTAAFGGAQGQLLLYKIRTVSLDNRPLEVKITSPSDPGETAQAELDV
jgi:hypothetical protein